MPQRRSEPAKNIISAERFAAAYENGRGKTINFLKSRGFPEDMAQEAAQAAWARGWERKEQLRDPRKSLPWVNSIALNLGRTLCRRSARFDELPEITAPAGHDQLAVIDVQRKLRDCPPRERELLEQRYMDEQELEDMARAQGCTNQAMRIRLYRARQVLKNIFEGTAQTA